MKHGSFAKPPAIVICGLLLAQAPAPLLLTEAAAMTAQQTAVESRNREIVVAAFDRWAAGGSDFFNEMLAPEVVWTIEGSGPSAGTYQGRDDFIARAVRPFASRMSTPVRPVAKRIWADGDHVVIHDVLRRVPAPSAGAEGSTKQPQRERTMSQHPYVGMWVTVDGRIRQELLPNGRYDEARGTRKSAYQGRYEVKGNHIDYWDDTGFTADGTFVSEDELHHGGMIFKRQK